LRELLGREVIMAGLLEKGFGRDLSEAFEMRQAALIIYMRASEKRGSAK